MESRIEFSTNGHAGKAKRSRKATAKTTPVAKDHLDRYANGGVALMAVLSAGLNGYANSLHATVPWAGWGMGLVIPAIVLVLGKVASLCWFRELRGLAWVTGGTGAGLLFLSVWHCSESISLLTGGELWLALPMAIAIDCGLVCCEVAALAAKK